MAASCKPLVINSTINMYEKFLDKSLNSTRQTVDDTFIAKYANAVSEKIIELWKEVGLGTFCDGLFRIINLEFGTGGPFSGMDTDEANPHIIEFLRERGTLVLEKKITHSYPHFEMPPHLFVHNRFLQTGQHQQRAFALLDGGIRRPQLRQSRRGRAVQGVQGRRRSG